MSHTRGSGPAQGPGHHLRGSTGQEHTRPHEGRWQGPLKAQERALRQADRPFHSLRPRRQVSPASSTRPSPTCWAGLTVLTWSWLCPPSRWVSQQPPAVPCSVPAQHLASVLCLHQHLRYRLSLQKLTSRLHTGASGGGCDKQEAQTQPAPGVRSPALADPWAQASPRKTPRTMSWTCS